METRWGLWAWAVGVARKSSQTGEPPEESIYSPARTPDARLTVVESRPRAALARRRTVDEAEQRHGGTVDGDGRAADVERVARGRRLARGVRAPKWLRSAASCFHARCGST
jgi:hypothetical protein